jgi:large exoprotein involved in heme utilization and adhesion
VNIKTGSLSVTNGALLESRTRGKGDAGNVTIEASETVFFDGGFIFSAVEKGAVGNAGDINLETGSLSLKNAQFLPGTSGQGNTGNVNIKASETVSFEEGSAIFSSVEPGAIGDGRNINIKTGSLSLINSAIESRTRGQGNAGNVNIEARNKISVERNSGVFTTVNPGAVGNAGNINLESGSLSISDSQLQSLTLGRGDAGDINLETGSLSVIGTQLVSATSRQGDAGNVNIKASETVSFDESAIFSTVESSAVGNAGDINIETRSLFVTDGSQLQSLIRSFGRGNAGDINIEASDTVLFDSLLNSEGNIVNFSAALSTVSEEAQGDAGDINVNMKTGSLSVTSGARLESRTLGRGDAGNININLSMGSLSVTDRAQLLSQTVGQGNAGDINIEASDTVSFEGIGKEFDFNSGAFSDVEIEGIGEAGNIEIVTEAFLATDGARISVDSKGNEPGGNIQIRADSLTLDGASILAETTSTNGGNITLPIQDLLILRNGSQISTTAGSDRTGGNGGNIEIDTLFLIAVPLENSDITANAFEGRGGRVDIINSQGIFGIEERARQTDFSDITASSELGLQGTVEIDNPNTDPSRTLVNLPVQPLETQVVQACQPGNNQEQSEFIITGRGGLPPTPQEELGTDSTGIDWVSLNPDVASQGNTEQTQENISNPSSIEVNNTTTSQQIVEAQGMVVGSNGKIVLTAQNSSAPEFVPNSCKSSHNH